MEQKTKKTTKTIQLWVFKVANWMEIIAAGFVTIAVIISFITLAIGMKDFIGELGHVDAFRNFLRIVFDVVIGIEFLKMLCKHNLGSVIEVLLFAIARQLIVEETSMLEGLIGVSAIGVLFMIRKYLYVEKIDYKEEENN
ncbi:MAG: hypothetical protein PHH48_01705 [Eubacteriales bacterium]|nr:hypothetical protein [Eubacteriales bacterium]